MDNTVVALAFFHSHNLVTKNCVISRIDPKSSFQKKLSPDLCLLDLKDLDLAVHQNLGNMSSLPRQLTHLQEKAWISSHMSQLDGIIYFLFWHLTCPSSVRIGICTSPLVVAVVDTGVVALRAPSLKSTGPQEATEVYSPTWKVTVGGLFKKGRASIFSPKCSHPPILPWLCRPSHLPRLSLLRRDLFRKLKAESGT